MDKELGRIDWSKSAKVIDLCIEAAYIDFNMIYDFGGTNSLPSNVVQGKKEWISGLESARTAAESAIKRFVDSWSAEE